MAALFSKQSLQCFNMFIIAITLSACDPVEQWNNTKTKAHRKMPGTNVFLIPPEGFVDKPAGDGIMYALFGSNKMQAITVSVYQREEAFHPDKTPAGKRNRKMIKVNQYDGYYEFEKKGDNLINETVRFGNDRVSVSIEAVISTPDTALVTKVRKAIRTVVLANEKLPGPADDAAFSIDVKNTTLKFARLINGILIYNEAGDLFSESNFGFIVGFEYGMIQPQAGQEQQIAADYLTNRSSYLNVQITESKPVVIDGLSGHAFVANGRHRISNDQDAIYLVLLYAREGTYIMLGTTNGLYEYRIARFKEVAQTFHLKKE
jgi:hypothetical protein